MQQFKKLLILVLLISLPLMGQAFERGIYITSTTAQLTKRMTYLIHEAKALGIHTFVIDVYGRSKAYTKNIALVRANGIKYVARVVVFPYGATMSQIRSQAIWEKRWQWAKYAVELGASAIQLDYIRFKHTQAGSNNNAQEVYRVIKFFRNKLAGTNVKLQIDIFGIAAIAPSKHIGQDAKIFAPSVNAICPMVYPSHYEPYREHAVTPYKTVLTSVEALKKQIAAFPNVQVYPFIELYNYRYPLSHSAKIAYIRAEMKAARDSGANGWYIWSPQNKYAILFSILRSWPNS